MGYLDKHRARLDAVGNTISNSLIQSEINFINSTFQDSPYYYEVTINDINTKGVIIGDMTSLIRSLNLRTILFGQKYMHMQPGDSVNLGDLVVWKSENWLVADFNSDDSIFPKAKIEKCNQTIPVVTGNTEIVTGYEESTGRPIIEEQVMTVDIPCIMNMHTANGSFSGDINVPTDRVDITCRYDDVSKNINENDEYTFYNRKYKVASIDFSSIYDGVGFITAVANRVT